MRYWSTCLRALVGLAEVRQNVPSSSAFSFNSTVHYFVEVRMKKGKIKKSITLFGFHSLLQELVSNGLQLLQGHRDFIPRHATGVLSCTELQVSPPLHCYSSAIHLWRSTVWRRAWEEKSQSEGRDEMRCDWLACGGKERMMQIEYAHPIRNQQMRWPCCHGNAPSAVEHWVWLCWCECYKILNWVWSQITWHSLLWNVQLPLPAAR